MYIFHITATGYPTSKFTLLMRIENVHTKLFIKQRFLANINIVHTILLCHAN